MKIISFEGIDKTGKSTLIKKFNEITKFKYLALDRFIISYIAYAEIYNREYVDKRSVIKQLLNLSSSLVIVFVTSDKKDILKRLKESNHENIDIDKEEKVFRKYIDFSKSLGIKVIEINTSKMNIKQSIKYILNELGEIYEQ